MFRVGYYQFHPEFGEVAKNRDKVVSILKGIRADLIVLPELPFTGYNFRDRSELASLSESPENSDTVEKLARLCHYQDFYIVTGFAEKCGEKYFNSALLIGPGGLIHIYRKLHLFHKEKECFDPGDRLLSVQEIRGVKIGMMICFDWIFPEVSRVLALLGADLVCHPSNLVMDYCQQAMQTRCIENRVFSVTANRFGEDQRPHGGEVKFTGKSQILGPKGELIHRAPSKREEVFIADIDVTFSRDKRVMPDNHLIQDRRPELYSFLCER
ncbi:MAG: hypothetical protein B6244_04515 [Candidatus Cloacimonetes bacterium 4572_55]|nr:MAG: hypothetical protein B6244_04515 [Candidatus Cloacimonetes bacterium 4572_55]